MPIDLQDIINRVTIEKTAQEAPEASAEVVTEPVVVPVEPTEDEQQKVAAEMDAAGRIMARAFHDELNKIAVSAHGYVDTAAELPETPVQVSKQPERLENTMKAVSILQQLTAGERVKGPEGYIQVNGQIVDGTAPEIPVEEHPTAYDATKQASANVISAVYSRFFEGK